MIGYKRLGVRRARQPLLFRNPFNSTGFQNPVTRLLAGPLINEAGPQTPEQQAFMQMVAAKAGKPDPSQKGPALNMKNIEKAGLNPNAIRAALNAANPAAALMSGINSYYHRPPTSVKNVETYENQLAAQRAAERANANIYSMEEYEQQRKAKLQEKQKEAEERAKLVKYFATNENVKVKDIPKELYDEIKLFYASPEYYRTYGYTYTKIARKRLMAKWRAENNERLQKKLPVKALPRLALYYPFPEGLDPIQFYSEEKEKNKRTNEQKKEQNQEKRASGDNSGNAATNAATTNTAPSGTTGETNIAGLFDQSQGQGQGQGKGAIGWRSTPIYRMVQPQFDLEAMVVHPDKEREAQEKELEQRREAYKQKQTDLHGKPPPKDMIKRAMPDLAEPSKIESNVAGSIIGVVPHTFIMPAKRFKLSAV